MRSVRSQGDSDKVRAGWSDDSALVCPVGEDRTRQEFADDADVNVILRRFSAGGFESRPVSYGMQDFGLDLQSVLASAEIASAAWLKVPEAARARYGGWQELLAAIERGEAALTPAEVPATADKPVAA